MGFTKTGDAKVIGQPKEYGELTGKGKMKKKEEKKGEKDAGVRRSK